ncbi:3-hydroxyacyl-CoA dehydrogenase NAD-binding domain-containing protein [Sneathiella marina]|uniref:3-hydroxyacyl-CoA dehydrogenase NAD-binding domain-containing protein n=1 Tax=Sneathiella marina TaxID=2950108 RepID=A0ABY4W8Y2_9PROT|nr:3-hydroxyacyl-CoA dehydrogenase/enoyl-CoA hydratase family protein [Sneathiella marina]USG62215.1 3-hydroxyacyl-CoA dehydrogenase NAD-binding domain-containing protein [Sneathiella marina]
MTKEIRKVAVIGAGTMGAGIAGQVANAGVNVLLLDLPSEGASVNALAERGMDRLRDPASPGLMSDEAGNRIEIGNTRDDFHKLADCDWVAEAIVERLDIKQDLYRRLNETCRDDVIVTSNTSTIPIRLLTEGLPKSFAERFAITHFFNPVRFMRLLELVRGEHTRDDIIKMFDTFCEQRLGKGVVICADTPGFLGNRVGVFAIQCALHTAFDMGLSPTEADALFSRPMGIPKTGVFGLYDLIGIDLMADVAQSLVNILPAHDAFHKYGNPLPLMTKMIADGQKGNKSGQGFYREKEGERQVLDLESGEYVDFERLDLPLAARAERDGVVELFNDNSRYGDYTWRVLSQTLCYAASLIPEIGEDPVPIDDAMKLGYNWIHGPFELIDQIGVDRFIDRLELEGSEIPPFLQKARGSSFYAVENNILKNRWDHGSLRPLLRADGVLRFSEVRQTLKAQNENSSASWFEYEGAAVVEFHSKANALDGDSMRILNDAVTQAPNKNLNGVIVHNDAQHFSCGVNLGGVRSFFENEDYAGLDQFLDRDFQQIVLAMRECALPVVVAPSGLSIGGGFEVVLHADHVICHSNSVMGLVESLVGVVPGGGGCKENLYRWYEKTGDMEKAAWNAFMNIGMGRTATSPVLAKQQAMLRQNDEFLMNRDRLLSSALTVLPNIKKAPARAPIPLAGKPSFDKMQDWLNTAKDKGMIMAHDVTVGTEIGRIVSGGDCEPGTLASEQDLFNAERKAFLILAKTPETQARIVSMLDTGKSLRN